MNSKIPTDGIFEFMSPEFRKRWHGVVSVTSDKRIIPMPCVPLQSIFDIFYVDAIDFWSLDVEGAELQVRDNLGAS